MTRARIGSIILRPFKSRLHKLQWERSELVYGIIWARNPQPPIPQRYIDRLIAEGGDSAADAVMRHNPDEDRRMIEKSYPRRLVKHDRKVARLNAQIGFIKRVLRLQR